MLPDESFDVVIAANVIHLLDDPYKALSELDRVCRPGGKLIIPTYVNKDKAIISKYLCFCLGKTLNRCYYSAICFLYFVYH